MNKNKITNLEKFALSVAQLKFAVNVPDSSPLYLEGTIQCFEVCFEMARKAMKDVLWKIKGVNVRHTKSIFQEAFIANWIENETIWLSMLDDRNNTSHTYNKDLAKMIYEHIHDHYFAELQRMLDVLNLEMVK